jgi:hypothetical protein
MKRRMSRAVMSRAPNRLVVSSSWRASRSGLLAEVKGSNILNEQKRQNFKISYCIDGGKRMKGSSVSRYWQ